jgi:hypothetical protein
MPLWRDWRCKSMILNRSDRAYSSFVLASCDLGHGGKPLRINGDCDRRGMKEKGPKAGCREPTIPEKIRKHPKKPEDSEGVPQAGQGPVGSRPRSYDRRIGAVFDRGGGYLSMVPQRSAATNCTHRGRRTAGAFPHNQCNCARGGAGILWETRLISGSVRSIFPFVKDLARER